jgi:hypothetical protein
MTVPRHLAGRRYNCRCGKKRYRDEESALAAAATDAGEHGGAVTAYRCPGGLAWHLTTRGVLPASLRTVGRRLAWELLTRDRVELDDFVARVLRGERRRRRAEEVAAALAGAGVVREDGALHPVDRAALERIVQVGLDAWLAGRKAGPADGGQPDTIDTVEGRRG